MYSIIISLKTMEGDLGGEVMKRNLFHLSVTALVLAAVAGCGGAGSSGKGFGKTPALGELTVTLGPAHPGTIQNARIPLGTTSDVVMLQVRMAADGVEDIRVNNMTVHGLGSGDEVADIATLTGVSAYLDTDNDGAIDAASTPIQSSAYSTNGGAVSFFINTVVQKNSFKNFLIVYDFNATSAGGSTFMAYVNPPADVTATGITSAEPPTLNSAPITGITATITGTLTLSRGTATPASANISNHASGRSVLQLNLAADAAENITVSSLRISAGTTTLHEVNDLLASQAVGLYADTNSDGIYQPGTDVQLGTPQVYSTEDGSIDFTGISRVITAGTSQDWIVVYSLDADGGENFTVQVTQASDLTGSGVLSTQAPFVAGTFPIVSNAFATIQTGVLTVIAGATNPTSNTYIPEGSTNQLVLAINLSVDSYEAITVTSITFTHAGTGVLTGATPNDLAQARLYNIDGAVNIATTTTFTANTITFSGLSQAIGINQNRNWALYLNFSSGLTSSGGNTFRFAVASGNDVSGTGATSGGFGVTINGTLGSTLPQGPTPTFTLQETLEVRRGANSPPSGGIGTAGVAANKEILQLEFRAFCDQVRISSITLLPSGAGDDFNEVTAVDIYVDANNDGLVTAPGDTQIATSAYTQDNTAQTFTFSTQQVITPGTSLFLLVYYHFGTTGTPGDNYTVSVRQTDLSPYGLGSQMSITPTVGTPPGTWPIQGAVLSYGANLLLQAAGSNPGNSTSVLRNSTQFLMAAFRLTESTNLEAVDVTSLTITAVGGMSNPTFLNTQIAAVRLFVDMNGNNTLDRATEQRDVTKTYSNSSNQITFTITAGPTQFRVAQNGSLTFWVEYDFTAVAANQPWVGCSFAVSIASVNDITANGLTTGSASISGTLPVRGGYQVIQGVWSQLTVNSAVWGTFSTYGVFQNSMIYCPLGGTGGSGRLIATGGLSHDRNQAPGSNTWITWGTYSLDLGAASLAWVTIPNTGSLPGGTNVGHADGTMAYCTIGGTPYFLYYGGQYNTGYANQGTYTYDLSTPAPANPWAQVNYGTSTSPSGQGRFRNGWGIDRTGTNPVLYVFGGFDGTNRLQDLYTLTLTSATAGTWAQITNATGTAPSGRAWAAGCLDTTSTGTTTYNLLICGGETGTALAADGAYMATGTTPAWSGLNSFTNPRSQSAYAYDPDGKTFFVFGGLELSGGPPPFNQGSRALEIHLMGCPTGTGNPPYKAYYGGTSELPNSPSGPGAAAGVGGRGRMPGVWDSVRHRFIIFGGSNMAALTLNPPRTAAPYTDHISDINIYTLG